MQLPVTALLRIALCCCLWMVGGGLASAAAPDDCGTPENMTARFNAEGQRTIASADHIERENNLNTLYGVLFTMNADRSLGYILRSDKPVDERATKLCVYKRLAGVRLFNIRKTAAQSGALLKASDADACRHCAELEKLKAVGQGSCGSLNELLRISEEKGERVMMQGFNLEKQANGLYAKNGTLATISGNLSLKLFDDPKEPQKGIVSGVYFTSLPDGATIINMTLVYAKYTPYGLSLLEQDGL